MCCIHEELIWLLRREPAAAARRAPAAGATGARRSCAGAGARGTA